MEQANDVGAGLDALAPILRKTRVIRRQTRWIRGLFALLILLTIVLFGWCLVSHIRRFDTEKFAEKMASKAERTWPVLADEFDKWVKAVLPTVRKAAASELEAAAEDIGKAFDRQAEILQQQVTNQIELTLKRHLVLKERAEAIRVIQEAFPQFKDQTQVDRLAEELQKSFLSSTRKELATMLAGYHDTLMEYEKTFRKLKAGIPKGQQPATFETLLSLWIELIYEKMGGDSALESLPAKTKSREGKGKRK